MTEEEATILVGLSGGTIEDVKKFIEDINKLLNLGFWWSDAHSISLLLNDYSFKMGTAEWETFLDRLVGNHTFSTRKGNVTKNPLLDYDYATVKKNAS